MSKRAKTTRERGATAPDCLPEQMHYADTGCEAAVSCLMCPLPMCKFDDPAWYHAYKTRERDKEVAAAFRDEGLAVFEVADRLGISARTVHRALSRMKLAPAAQAA